jgi:hypothetical protein
MHRSIGRLFAAALLACPAILAAQSSQAYAVQISAFGTGIVVRDGVLTGYGVEPQFRINHVAEPSAGVLSIGLGGQYTTHKSGDGFTLKVMGAFVEPRLVIRTNQKTVFPYLAARVAIMQQSSDFLSTTSGYAFGGGGGLAIKLTPSINLDAGVAILYQSFADAKTSTNVVYTFGALASYAAKIGLNIGFP